jgi:hypothetical protein
METGMLLKILKRSFSGLILFLSVQMQAQEKDNGTPLTLSEENARKDTVTTLAKESEWLPTTSIYIELGGRVLYSLNVDFRKRENFALCIGASYFKEGDGDSNEYSQSMFFPSVMGYYLGGKRHRLELGGGLCAGFGSSQGFAAMALYGSAGYRYQKKKGLIFRVGFTPFLTIPISEDDSFAVIPWAGISLGYSF